MTIEGRLATINRYREHLSKWERDWTCLELSDYLKSAWVCLSTDNEDLRNCLSVLRDHILNWPETQARVFTVEDAKQLNVCRICKKSSIPLPDNPLILNYGKEFAHQKCLEEKTDDVNLIRDMQCF